MNADEDQMSADLNKITEKIIGCAYVVANSLGSGFLEKVYENALAHELRKSGLSLEQQREIDVQYDGILVGSYCADLLVNGAVLVELKAIKALDDVHVAQCLNYLRAMGLRICLLINFGTPRIEIKRIVNGF
ncbi:MAG: GxxExxY protein [Acidobacteria bacterium]|nr:GxxExxY protein [Acidobacteriota bacterium]